MTAVVQALRAGLDAAINYSGVSVTIQSRTFTAGSPHSDAAEWTTSEQSVKGILSVVEKRSPTEGDGHREYTYLTVNSGHLDQEPNAGTVIQHGSRYYTVDEVKLQQGALYQLRLGGPTTSAAVAADVTGPRFSDLVLNDGVTTLTWSATSNEGAHSRLRYRKGQFQPWTYIAWVTASYLTSHAGTTAELPYAGLWTFHIQGRDAAGNIGAWFNLGDATTSGTPE